MHTEKRYPNLCSFTKKVVAHAFLIGIGVVFLASILGCTHITLPNTQVCTVAGVISEGADCANTGSDETSSMTFGEFLEFLEPQAERPDPADPAKVIPARGGALCQSAEQWNRLKTELEKACEKLGKYCTRETKQVMTQVSARLTRLEQRALSKAKRKPRGSS